MKYHKEYPEAVYKIWSINGLMITHLHWMM